MKFYITGTIRNHIDLILSGVGMVSSINQTKQFLSSLHGSKHYTFMLEITDKTKTLTRTKNVAAFLCSQILLTKIEYRIESCLWYFQCLTSARVGREETIWHAEVVGKSMTCRIWPNLSNTRSWIATRKTHKSPKVGNIFNMLTWDYNVSF